MADEIVKVIRVDTGQAENSIRDYKNEIDALKSKLQSLDKTSQDYEKTLRELRTAQDNLGQAMQTSISSTTTSNFSSLSRTVDNLKDKWNSFLNIFKGSTKNDLKEISTELRNASDAGLTFSQNITGFDRQFDNLFKSTLNGLRSIDGPLGSITMQVAKLIPSIKAATSAATTGLAAIKTGIASTGIGLLLIAVSQLALGFQSLSDDIDLATGRLANYKSETLTTIGDIKERWGTFIQGFAAKTLFYFDELFDELGSLGRVFNHLINGEFKEIGEEISNQRQRAAARAKAEEEELQKIAEKPYRDRLEKQREELKKNFDMTLRMINVNEKEKEAVAKMQYAKGQITEKQYNEKIYEIKQEAYDKQLNLYNEYRRDLVKTREEELDLEEKEQAVRLAQSDLLAEHILKQKQEALNRLKELMEDYNTLEKQVQLNLEKQTLEVQKQYQNEEDQFRHLVKVRREGINTEKTELEKLIQKAKDINAPLSTRIDLETKYVELLKEENEIAKEIADRENKRLQAAIQKDQDAIDKVYGQQTFDVNYDVQYLIDDIDKLKEKTNKLYDIEKERLEEHIKSIQEFLECDTLVADQRMELEKQIADYTIELQNNEKKRAHELAQYEIREAETSFKRRQAIWNLALRTSGQIFGAMSDLMEENSAQAKAFAIMEVIANTGSAAMNAYKAGIMTVPNPIWVGQALGIAGVAAAALQGAAQIKSIKNAGKNSSESSLSSSAGGITVDRSISAIGVNPLINEQADLERLQNMPIVGDSEKKDTRVYVVESDIEDVKNRVQVRESNATF